MLALAALLLATQAPLAWRGHAHNDYLHERPFEDAYSYHFNSFEADIFLVDGELRVGHERSQLKPERTLQSLYLDPIRRTVQAWQRFPYTARPEMTLLVDVKTDGIAVCRELSRILPAYKELLSIYSPDRIRTGALRIVISGDRPKELWDTSVSSYLFVDGRLSDLATDNPRVSLISDNFTSIFKWTGKELMSGEERARLSDYVRQAHAKGRKIRFWAHPDTPQGWEEMMNAGVDLINTDKLSEFWRWTNKTRASTPHGWFPEQKPRTSFRGAPATPGQNVL